MSFSLRSLTFLRSSKICWSRTGEHTADNSAMEDDVKLTIAFLALNAGVIALAIAGYAKAGMNIGAVIQHLSQSY